MSQVLNCQNVSNNTCPPAFWRDSCASGALITYPGKMGEVAVKKTGFVPHVAGSLKGCFTTGKDTQNAAKEMAEQKDDLLLFAGGDGTARDIYQSIRDSVTILGIPAGVKVHSAVFATNPQNAGELAIRFLLGNNTKFIDAEVLDLNEDNYRKGILDAKLYGYLKIPY